jgi:hypothetical protein
MLTKMLCFTHVSPGKILKIKFNMAVSWKKIKEKIFEREKYFKDYEMTSGALRIDHDKYKVYLTPKSPEVVRTD